MSFDTLLIANRGEIACRVIATARRMGLRCIAVHSDGDAGARHVAMADDAVALGGRTPAESYLDAGKIVAAMQATGAGAVHPGYGFLSENPDFVEAVEAAGLVFVGPSAAAIRAMGLKDEAKRVMEAAGVPVVPGHHGAAQDADRLRAAAEEIGWPVLIKAVAGGGGKGMRAVAGPGEWDEALAAARAEAKGAFGVDRVLIEKLVARPRHIEIQVFGDGRRALHLFERDCSLQRRHQKVIEEAPAPGMTAAMREAMGAAAVRAAEAVDYAGAGTVEFICDTSEGLRPDRFWFMEMNTRLQVEHPVTEAVTGVDLVEWQLRVAAGEPLPARQEDLTLSGHAVEARLYAEDPAAGFLPSTGRIAHLRLPEGLARVDTGVREGDEVSADFDPMIAKITTHGPDRETAFARLDRALAATEVAGPETNLDFLTRLAADDDVRAGRLDTGLIARAGDRLAARPALSDAALARAALAILDPEEGPRAGFTLWRPLTHRLTLDGREVAVTLRRGGGASVSIDGGPPIALGGAGRVHAGPAVVAVFGPGGGRVARPDPLARGQDAPQGGVAAPMPGRVVRLAVAEGDAVRAGQTIAVLEAMKMEHRLTAHEDGVVGALMVAEGDQVEAGRPLMRIDPADAPAA